MSSFSVLRNEFARFSDHGEEFIPGFSEEIKRIHGFSDEKWRFSGSRNPLSLPPGEYLVMGWSFLLSFAPTFGFPEFYIPILVYRIFSSHSTPNRHSNFFRSILGFFSKKRGRRHFFDQKKGAKGTKTFNSII